ncbi:CHAT domain-containing protein [Actinomadura harenae]|uniref:CHAT domain-containing protein n=1 Tax=Actinomadura harenae TaxID=2483351 RepID=A0A3M2LLB1_9ACTN|nr:CHAT domain-containing protein [Actinomadura harenae]RMI38214.1 CHAT domain-containing protein [Actinomadura harenae]
MTEFARRIGVLRAEEATLPPGPGPRRTEIGVLKGMLIADGCLRLRPDDDAPAVPASRELLDEGIAGLSGGTSDDPARLVRLGVLLFVRLRVAEGPERDAEDAITALRTAAVHPAVAPVDLPICCLLLGQSLITRHLPKALRATRPGELDRVVSIMAGFQLDRARAVPDITRGIAFLDDEAASDLWPAPVRAWARMSAQVGRLLIEEDLGRRLDLMINLLSDTEGLTHMAGTEDWLPALTAWAELRKARESGSPEMTREAADKADDIFGALTPSDVMRALLAQELGRTSLDTFHDLEEALRYLTEGEELLSADHPYFSIMRSILADVTTITEFTDPWRSRPPGEVGVPAVDRAVELAREVAADARRKASETGSAEDASDAARQEFLLGMTLFLRWIRDGGDEAHREAASVVHAALPRLPGDDRTIPAAMGLFGAVLSGTHLAHGSLQHAQAARTFFTTARDLVRAGPEENTGLTMMCGVMASMRAQEAWERQETEEFAKARDELAWAVGVLPADHPWRRFLAGILALLRLQHAIGANDTNEVRSALAELAELGDAAPPDTDRPWLQGLNVMTASVSLMYGLLEDDEPQIAASVEALERAAATETFSQAQRLALLSTLAQGQLARPGGLGTSIAYLREALALLPPDGGGAMAPSLLSTLAEALRRRRGPDDDAVGTGLLALRAQLRGVLLQIGPEDGMVGARTAGRLATQVAAWALEDGEPARAVEALELGRGMVLHAATTFTSTPELLREAGREDLAEQWCARRPDRLLPADPMNLLLTAVTGGEMAADLHRRAVTVLAERPAADRLFTPPVPPELGAALERAGADALVYLCPGTEHGWALIIGRNGEPLAEPLPGLAAADTEPLRRYVEARERQAVDRADWAAALGDLCDWAWPGIMANVLARCVPLAADGRPRIVLVPTGELGLVCWHAARRPAGERLRYICEDAVISYAASGRQLADPVTVAHAARTAAVLVADPGDGDAPRLAFAVTETEALRDAFYQDGRMLGDEAEPGFERGTVAAVRAALRTATMVHLATHGVAYATPVDSALMLGHEDGTDGRLRLADLLDDPGSCRACELLVLSACVTDLTSAVYDEVLTLSTAFRSAGVAEVIGSRWLVDDATTPVMMYVFHHELNRGADPAEALRRSQCWMADPGRDLAELPNDLYHLATEPDRPLEDPASWAAFTHQGVPASRPGCSE